MLSQWRRKLNITAGLSNTWQLPEMSVYNVPSYNFSINSVKVRTLVIKS
jgi:hypothetical protein